MYNHVNERSGLKAPLVADDVYEIIMEVLSGLCKLLSSGNFISETRALVYVLVLEFVGTLCIVAISSGD